MLIFSQADDKTWTPDMTEAMFRFYLKSTKAPDLTGGHVVMMAKPEEYFAILKGFIPKKTERWLLIFDRERNRNDVLWNDRNGDDLQ